MGTYPEPLKQWIGEVSRHMSHLGKGEQVVLGLYSLASAVLGHCGQTQVSTLLGLWLGKSVNTMRQRLREFMYEGWQKAGRQRRTLDVTASFAPLMAWVIRLWERRPDRLYLVLDVTYLRDRFMILGVSVVYRGCAVPVAWHVLASETPGSWQPHWRRLLGSLQPAIPDDWTVLVLTDRGLASSELFEIIQSFGWHPVMRIEHSQAMYRRPHQQTWRRLQRLARPGMGIWCQRVQVWKNEPFNCTLLVTWDARYLDPCLVITDLPPGAIRPRVYALRVWIEAGFKDLKRGGLHWEQTQMRHPARVARFWLILAVTMLYLVAVGGLAQETLELCPATTRPAYPPLSCATLGRLMVLVALLTAQPLPGGALLSYDWLRTPP